MHHVPDAVLKDAAVQNMKAALAVREQVGSATGAAGLADQFPVLETAPAPGAGKIKCRAFLTGCFAIVQPNNAHLSVRQQGYIIIALVITGCVIH